MKESQILPILAIVVIVGLVAFFGFRKEDDQIPVISNQDSIIGCYAAIAQNDVYTLNVESQDGVDVTGTLEFKNYQKDSSSGLLTGTYKDGILFGDYSFRSEGTDSVMQVIFEKVGDNFIRGYGSMNTDGTKFVNLDNVTYDASSALMVFKKGQCVNSISQVIFPSGGESLVAGQKYTLKWSGGPDTTQIFLVDKDLKLIGASVSITDRVYNIKNTGSYEYTIPKTVKPGEYEFQIGDATSNTFNIVSK